MLSGKFDLDALFLQIFEKLVTDPFLFVIHREGIRCFFVPAWDALIELAGYLGLSDLNTFDLAILRILYKVSPTDIIALLPLLEHHHHCEYRNCDYEVAKGAALIAMRGRLLARLVLLAATLRQI